MNTAILFIIFNRPETTQQVFNMIRKARPSRLYIAADGPRGDRPDDAAKCAESKRIASGVDWDCEVRTLFRTSNLGCGKGPASAISWFFEQESEGIILEDDCKPSLTLFPFFEELLARYRDDTRIMEIGGNNFEIPAERDEEYSYRFSNHISIWGWATWRRAWKYHDFHMGLYQEIQNKGYLDAAFGTHYESDFYHYVFSKMYKGDDQTNSKTIWDYQWQFACKVNSGLIIIPNRNLVQNLGFGEDATNTLNPTGVGHNLKLEEIEFPLKHPEFIMADELKDNLAFRKLNTSPSSRAKSDLKRILPTPLVKFLKPIRQIFV